MTRKRGRKQTTGFDEQYASNIVFGAAACRTHLVSSMGRTRIQHQNAVLPHCQFPWSSQSRQTLLAMDIPPSQKSPKDGRTEKSSLELDILLPPTERTKDGRFYSLKLPRAYGNNESRMERERRRRRNKWPPFCLAFC